MARLRQPRLSHRQRGGERQPLIVSRFDPLIPEDHQRRGARLPGGPCWVAVTEPADHAWAFTTDAHSSTILEPGKGQWKAGRFVQSNAAMTGAADTDEAIVSSIGVLYVYDAGPTRSKASASIRSSLTWRRIITWAFPVRRRALRCSGLQSSPTEPQRGGDGPPSPPPPAFANCSSQSCFGEPTALPASRSYQTFPNSVHPPGIKPSNGAPPNRGCEPRPLGTGLPAPRAGLEPWSECSPPSECCSIAP